MTTSVSFAFRAVRHDGKVDAGIVEAPNREAAIALIGSRGAFAIEVSPRHMDAARKVRMSPEDLAAGLRGLSTLVGSGIPLARALVILDDLVPPSWLPALPAVRRCVDQGGALAGALDDSTLPLPASVIGIIRAGESGSGLASALERTADLLEAGAATRTAIRNALAYPMLLAVAGTASTALLVGFVLPRFVDLLSDAGQRLPLMSRLVMGMGAVFEAMVVPTLLLVVGGAVVWHVWVANDAGRRQWHRLLLATPLLGTFRRASAAAAACSALAALLESGVPIVRALRLAAGATGDLAIAERLANAGRRIETGERVSSALESEWALTPAVVRIARVGEESGELAQMFAHAATIEARHALQRVQRSVRIIEPALILAFGGLVMIVAAAMLQAMYGLRPTF